MSGYDLFITACAEVAILGGARSALWPSGLDRYAPDDPEAARAYRTAVRKQRRVSGICLLLLGTGQLVAILIHHSHLIISE